MWSRGFLFAVAAVGFASVAAGQTIPSSELPGRERQRFVEPPPPQAKPFGPTLSLPGTVAPAEAATISLVIIDFKVEGSTVYRSDQFKPLYADLIKTKVPLSAVYDVAQRITAKYGADGYVLSRAIVPPQELDPAGAVVKIEVVEGYIDRVEWPSSLARYRNFFSRYSEKITAERPTNIRTVMRYLLLANDLPGISVGSRFQASEENPRASTLIIEAETKPFEVSGRIDNYGTEPRGPWEFSASATANNWLGMHEAFTGTVAGAFQTDELLYVALDYRQVISSEGLTLFANASYTWGEPGTPPLLILEYNSLGLNIETGLRYPLIRSREKNLAVSGRFFYNNSNGEILSEPSSEDRLRGFRVSADFDIADETNAVSQVFATISQGIHGLGSSDNDDPLNSRAAGRVDFTTVDATAIRVQPLFGDWSARGMVQGQYAFTPLPSQEECGFGGRELGRAFDPSEITGDSCFAALAELRYDLDLPGLPVSLSQQLYAFADYGYVYRIDPSDGTSKTDEGASAGIGVRVAWNDRLATDISAAKPLIGREDDDWRYFLVASARY